MLGKNNLGIEKVKLSNNARKFKDHRNGNNLPPTVGAQAAARTERSRAIKQRN